MRSIFWTLVFYELKIKHLLSTCCVPYLASQLVLLHFSNTWDRLYSLARFLRNSAMQGRFLEHILFLPFISSKKASVLAFVYNWGIWSVISLKEFARILQIISHSTGTNTCFKMKSLTESMIGTRIENSVY